MQKPRPHRELVFEELCDHCKDHFSSEKECCYCYEMVPKEQIDEEFYGRCKKCVKRWHEWQEEMAGKGRGGDDLGRGASNAVARSRFYRKTIGDGVKGRDLIQPFHEDGKPNSDFIDHYGKKEYTKEVQSDIH